MDEGAADLGPLLGPKAPCRDPKLRRPLSYRSASLRGLSVPIVAEDVRRIFRVRHSALLVTVQLPDGHRALEVPVPPPVPIRQPLHVADREPALPGVAVTRVVDEGVPPVVALLLGVPDTRARTR